MRLCKMFLLGSILLAACTPSKFAPLPGWQESSRTVITEKTAEKKATPKKEYAVDTRSAGEVIELGLDAFFDLRARSRKASNESLEHRAAWQNLFLAIDKGCEKQPIADDLGVFIRTRMAIEVESDLDLRRGRDLGKNFTRDVESHVACVHDRVVELRAMGAPGTVSDDLPAVILGSAHFSLPVVPMVVSSPFGVRSDPFTGKRRFHAGVDVSAPFGTDVVAVMAARVVYAGKQGGYGNHVVLEHGNGLRTHYSHLRKIVVKQGQKVDKGERIATVGATGRATGPHLHFALSNSKGEFVDPLDVVERGLIMRVDEQKTNAATMNSREETLQENEN